MLRFPALLSQTRICVWRLRIRPETQIQLILNRPDRKIQAAPFSISPLFRFYKKNTDPLREICPTEPHVEQPSNYKPFLVFLSFLIITGNFIVYAKHNPTLRENLAIYTPWLDDLIAIIHQENRTYIQTIMYTIKDIQKKIELMSSVTEETNGNRSQNEDQVCVSNAKTQEELDEEEGSDGSDEKSLTPEVSICDVLEPNKDIKDMCQIEECIWEQGEASINNYYTAKEACAYYIRYIEDVMLRYTPARFNTVKAEKETRDVLVKTHVRKAEEAAKMLDVLEEMLGSLECNVNLKNDPLIERARDTLKDLRVRVAIARIEYEWESDRAKAWDEALPKFGDFVNLYMAENKAVYPGTDYCEDRPKLLYDLDWLLHHTQRRMREKLKEVMVYSNLITSRIDRAIDRLPGKPEDKECKCDEVVKKKLEDLNKEYEDRMAEQTNITEMETKKMMDEADKAFEENLEHNLMIKEEELNCKLAEQLEAELEEDRVKQNEELKEMNEKLLEVQTRFYGLSLIQALYSIKVEVTESLATAFQSQIVKVVGIGKHINADRERHRSRSLYAAAASILQKCKGAQPLVPVEKELDDIEKSKGSCDVLIDAVIRSIPEQARRKGVVPESHLWERYLRVEKMALRVSLVEAEGSPLIVYLISFLQSLFLFMKVNDVPQAEKDCPPKELKNFDTFDLLQRSRYYMENGNMAEALRYVNALQGASRAATLGWYEDAKVHLETRQVAETVIAHAAAIGLKYMG